MYKNKILKILTIMFLILILFVCSISGQENGYTVLKGENDIYIDDIPFSFTEDSFIYNDRTYVPLRSFAETLDYTVEWREENQSIYIEQPQAQEYAEEQFGEYVDGTHQVSLIHLIANPEKYDGKRICVMGVINVGFEVDRLFLTEEDRIFGNGANSIILNYRTDNRLGVELEELEKISGHYVEIEGIFKQGEEVEDYYTPGLLTEINVIYCCRSYQ